MLNLKSESVNWADFLHADTNLWKLKVTLIIIGWVWSKMGEALKIVGFLNQVYLTNDLMNWADGLNDFCMSLWHLNAGRPLYLARVFRKNSLCAKMTTKKRFFLLILKILSLIFAGNVLK